MAVVRDGNRCIWTNERCQLIESLVALVSPTTYFPVNSNACDLVNTQAVQYDQTLSICTSQLDQIALSCNSKGINSETCTQLTNKNCEWIYTKKVC